VEYRWDGRRFEVAHEACDAHAVTGGGFGEVDGTRLRWVFPRDASDLSKPFYEFDATPDGFHCVHYARERGSALLSWTYVSR
jgi:hypothetical protein